MKAIVLASLLLTAGSVSAFAQTINLSSVGQIYTQDFDSIVATAGAFSSTSGTQAAIPGLTGWSGVKLGGTGSTAMNLSADAGTGTTAALYSYGAASATDRALGSLASGTNIPGFGAAFVNNTGATLTSFTLNFTSEFWRSSTSAQNILSFAYGLSGGGITSANYLSSASMTSFSSLNVVGPVPVTTNGALNGNDAANQAAINQTLALVWNPGDTLFIRWQDANDLGNDAGLAIDNLTFTAIPEPSTYALFAGLAGLTVAALRRRRATAAV